MLPFAPLVWEVLISTALFAVASAVFVSKIFPKKPSQNNLSSLAIFNQHMETPFDQTKHEERLDAYARDHNVRDFKLIGFERPSPITDFRSFGILSLDILERSKIVETFDKELGYGLAMINIGFHLVQRMNDNKRFLSRFVFEPEECLDELATYLDTEMLAFLKFWRQNGEDVMAFNELLNQWMKKNW